LIMFAIRGFLEYCATWCTFEVCRAIICYASSPHNKI